MTDWIKWNGVECPIKSDKTRVEVQYSDRSIEGPSGSSSWIWHGQNDGRGTIIIAYRITEDHEPKMTREQITAQIEALQKQLDAMPVVQTMWYDGRHCWAAPTKNAAHTFDVETINGVPHIHGIAMKECGK